MLHVLISVVFLFFLNYFGSFEEAVAVTQKYETEGKRFAKERLKDFKKPKLEEIFEKKENLKKPEGEAVEGETCDNCVTILKSPEELMKSLNEGSRPQGEKEDEILVFVSFSMPNVSLKELDEHAEKYNAKLVLRGLHADSFRKTAEKILEINPKGLRCDINPQEFKKYQINKVPTFILIKSGKEVSRLSGNVSLEYAASKLRGK